MDRKSSGWDFDRYQAADREAFVQPLPRSANYSGSKLPGLAFLVIALAVVGFFGTRALSQGTDYDPPADNNTRDMVQVEQRLSEIESRLAALEQNHPRAAAAISPRADAPVAENRSVDRPREQVQDPPARPRPVETQSYQRPPASRQQVIVSPQPDPTTSRRIDGLQQGLGEVQNDTVANRQALKSTADKLAAVSGQVGAQHMEVLRSQDELNQLLARSQRTAIPFELRRGPKAQPVGPVYVALKSASERSQRYTVCVYVDSACIELKDRSLNEVVEFVTSRNSPPMGFIATTITRDRILGYLEVSRDGTSR
jgi:DNA polymerase IIIc chi subunit